MTEDLSVRAIPLQYREERERLHHHHVPHPVEIPESEDGNQVPLDFLTPVDEEILPGDGKNTTDIE